MKPPEIYLTPAIYILSMNEINSLILEKVFKKRENWSYKYDYGSLLIIGGSKLYHGSPALAGLSALRSGVDLVTVIAPERAANLIASSSPDLITYPLKGNYINKRHVPTIMKFCENKTAVVIGGGLCRDKRTITAVKLFLKKIKLPTVIDADEIYALDKNILKKNFLITPHSREFYIMSGIRLGRFLSKRIESVKKASSLMKSTILLKGFVDIISDGKRAAVNRTGNPYMTKGGTGDTLAGICGSLLAQGISPFNAACAAAYINGKAGDFAAREKKQGLLATDLIAKIPKVF
jgi:hydroxyethylthiazole kinase-like uncharacterized protein yjeF